MEQGEWQRYYCLPYSRFNDNPTADQIHDPKENTRTEKLLGYEFYREVLKSPKYVMAPMVNDKRKIPFLK